MTLPIVDVVTSLYCGTGETPVDIVALDYDWGFEFDRADGRLETGQLPEQMGEDGVLYYGRFRCALDISEPTSPDTPGYRTIEEAKRHAESKVVGGIKWSAAPA